MRQFTTVDRNQMMLSWPLFAGILVTATGAVAAVTVTTHSVPFALLMHVLVAVGILSSFVAHMLRRSTTVVGLAVMVTGFMVLVLRQDLAAWADMVFPADLQSLEESTVAVLASWMLAGFCFMQGSRYNSVFIAATGMAILGLIATINIDLSFLMAFWTYTFGAVFTWGYEHLLHRADGAHVQPHGAAGWKSWSRWHLSASLLLLSLVLVVATVGGSLLHTVTPNFLGRMSSQIRQIPDLASDAVANTFGREDFRVGTGPVRLPEVEAFRVSAQMPALWRTEVYDHYVGSGWTKRDTRHRNMERLGFLHYQLPEAEQYQGTVNWQVFRFPTSISGFLPAATAPVQFQLHGNVDQAPPVQPDGRPLQPLRVDNHGCVRVSRLWSSDGFWGHTGRELLGHYEVLSMMPPTSQTSLRERGEDYLDDMVETYVRQVPVAAQTHLAELVEDTTAGITDPYDRVAALRDMVADRCLYSTEAPAVPMGKDASVYFLIHSKQGACDLFATALAVMARMAGVPARVAVGYQTGEYDSRDDAFVVKHSDAHAWAEMFFPEVGWVPFDVQAVRQYDEQTWLSLLLSGHAWLALLQVTGSLLPWLIVPLAAYAALSGVYDLRRRLSAHVRRPTPSAADRLGIEFLALCRTLASRARIKVTDAMTPQELVEGAVGRLSASQDLMQRMRRLTEQFYEARFAPAQPVRRVERLRLEVRKMRRRIPEFGRNTPKTDTNKS